MLDARPKAVIFGREKTRIGRAQRTGLSPWDALMTFPYCQDRQHSTTLFLKASSESAKAQGCPPEQGRQRMAPGGNGRKFQFPAFGKVHHCGYGFHIRLVLLKETPHQRVLNGPQTI